MKVCIKGFNSCTMRKQKLQQYRDYLLSNHHEIVGDPEESDFILLWTCAFRADVRENALTQIERFQSRYRDKLIVAGCLPDIDPKLLQEKFRGCIINWREDREKMAQFFGGGQADLDPHFRVYVEDRLCENAEEFRKEHADKDATFHDQFIKLLVSEGCNYQCAYCSERLAFPPYRSFPETALVEFCRQRVEQTGCKEIILLADSLGDYGCDIGTNLPGLIRRLKAISPDIKVALNNLNPACFIRFFDEMAEFLARGDIKHLNLPIQSASDRILKLMDRCYGKEEIEKLFSYLNKIGFKEFDTHVIAGFPGEGEEDFRDTVAFILKHRPKYVLASGFMESEGMSAFKLPGKVDDEVKRRRLKYFSSAMGMAGIICNTDYSRLSADRLRRLINAS